MRYTCINITNSNHVTQHLDPKSQVKTFTCSMCQLKIPIHKTPHMPTQVIYYPKIQSLYPVFIPWSVYPSYCSEHCCCWNSCLFSDSQESERVYCCNQCAKGPQTASRQTTALVITQLLVKESNTFSLSSAGCRLIYGGYRDFFLCVWIPLPSGKTIKPFRCLSLLAHGLQILTVGKYTLLSIQMCVYTK